MTSLADRTIGALRGEHDSLAALAPTLTDEQLSRTSGASEWSVADVLSHLGSGAEITLAALRAGTGSAPPPDGDLNQSVWDRWNALGPREQLSGFLEHDAELVAGFEALDEQQRESVQLDVGFLPFPLSVASFAGMRLNEATLHGWDVRVALDADAPLDHDSAAVLLDQFAGGLGFLLGFTGKADAVREPVVLDVDGSGYGLAIGADNVSVVTDAAAPTATFDGPIEAAIRLLAGRLTPPHTPAGLQVSGNVTLEQLRDVFPGY